MRKFTGLISLVVLIITISASNLLAQWSGVYGNEWLSGKYNQSWVKVDVSTKGIHKIAISLLPSNFQSADKSKLQLWHRGKQVSIIKADNNEILFYGVPNDGSSDELLYRLPTSRRNPYYSLYSDKSSYFLTISTTDAGLRAVSEELAVNTGISPLQFHDKTDISTYQNEFTHNTFYSSRPPTLNSFFEDGKTGTGSRLPVISDLTKIHTSNPASAYRPSYVSQPFSFQVKSLYGSSVPTMKILLSGRFGNASPEIFVGKTAATLRSVATISTSGFGPTEYSFPLTNIDYDLAGGTLGFRATVNLNYFSVTYFMLTYQQLIDMQGLNSYEFNFPATSAGSQSRFTVSNPVANLKFYDISKVDNPRIIIGNASDMMVSRDEAPLKLLATNQTVDVVAGNISSVTFEEINPASYDYLILTNGALYSSAVEYAEYRQNSSPGKKYKPIVKNIKDIYNQFNYGEPSTVAIRRFVDYMISNGDRNKFLLLMGKSVTRPDKMTRELPEEVPTVGFPGSDMLLVDGLGGVADDVLAIPVGRISAITEQQVRDYLAKIIVYENQTDLTWRKNVIHMSGGKTQSEINSFAGYLSSIGSSVINSPFLGKIIPKLKTIPEDVIDETTIAPEVNGTTISDVKGVGMVSYFGHGSTFRTDYNAGYATDAAKGYVNVGKYPVLFYNGCGVGNIFSNLFGETPNLSTSRPMSFDWLIAANKGAIVVFGNDWDAYATTSNEYLDRLYPLIFSKNDEQRKTIGEILQEVAAQTKIVKGYTYNITQNARTAAYYDADRANIHQVLLQGDPALRILLTENALPVDLIFFEAKVNGANNVELSWKTASEKNNSHFNVERSYNAKNFETIGTVEGKGDSNTENSYMFTDDKPLPGISYYRLIQVDGDLEVDGKNIDGKSTSSKIVSVNRPNTSLLVVSPNPSVDVVKIDLNSVVKVKSWNLINSQGYILLKNRTGTKVNLAGFQSGEYIIEITTENGDVFRKKVMKL